MKEKEKIESTLGFISCSQGHSGASKSNFKYIEEFKCNCILVGKFEFIIPDLDSKLYSWFSMSESPLHHVALEVEDINKTCSYLRDCNIPIISEKPVKGVNNTLVNFIHPLHCGVMIEIVQQLK